jgi:ZIP family zinc transporter
MYLFLLNNWSDKMPQINQILYVLMGTGFTFLATVLGASMVFFLKNDIKKNTHRLFLGFAAGVMIAAAVWSLLIPAIDMAKQIGQNPLISVIIGFILGGAFLMLLDVFTPHLHIKSNKTEGIPSNFKRTTKLVLAIALHNIPEGMSVGLAFSLAAQNTSSTAFATALALAFGMALQNFPEGAAVSLPLKKEGFSSKKAFNLGVLTGIIEPVFGLITVFVAGSIASTMPWLLSFAAGAMIYVVVEELIPEASLGEHSNIGPIGVMSGFLIMMILDIALG